MSRDTRQRIKSVILEFGAGEVLEIEGAQYSNIKGIIPLLGDVKVWFGDNTETNTFIEENGFTLSQNSLIDMDPYLFSKVQITGVNANKLHILT